MCCRSQARPVFRPRRAAVRPAHLCRGRGGRGCRCHQQGRRLAARVPPAFLAPELEEITLPQPAEMAVWPPCRPQGPPMPLFDTPFPDRKGMSWHNHIISNSSFRA